MEEPGRPQSAGLQRVGHNFTFFHFLLLILQAWLFTDHLIQQQGKCLAATSTSVSGLTHSHTLLLLKTPPLGAQPPCREPKMHRAAIAADTPGTDHAGSQTATGITFQPE